MKPKEIEHTPIYFIVAKGRSGTTLLQTIIDAHPNTCAPFESRFVVHFYNRYGSVIKWTDATKARFYNDIINEQKISLFWDFNVVQFKRLLKEMPEMSSYAYACKLVYLSFISFTDKGSVKCIVDKNPIYSVLLEIILKVFPDAKFIHVIRDPRAVINSTLKFNIRKNARQISKEWLINNLAIENLKMSQLSFFHTMKYEDLMQAPQNTLKLLCAFLNIDYQDQMLEYHSKMDAFLIDFLNPKLESKKLEIRSKGWNFTHKNLNKPINPNFIDKWKNELSEKQIQTIESIVYKYASKFDYDFETAASSNVDNIRFYDNLSSNKLKLYYKLPIWLRELKSKPSMPYLEYAK